MLFQPEGFVEADEHVWSHWENLARQSVAELKVTLKGRNVPLRLLALFAIARKGQGAIEALPEVLEALHDPSFEYVDIPMGYAPSSAICYHVRYAAIFALYSLAPERMAEARPIMLELRGKMSYLMNTAHTTEGIDLYLDFPAALWAAAGGKPDGPSQSIN